MFLVKCFLLKPVEGAEHGQVSHVVSIEDAVAARKIGRASRLYEYGTGIAFFPFIIFMEVFVPLTALKDRIVDLCPGDSDPCDDIRIDLF